MSITDVAAVTVEYNVAVRDGDAVRRLAEDAGIVFSSWHPGAMPAGDEGDTFHAVIVSIAARDATPPQAALAWQFTARRALPIPGTTSVQHLKENLAAARIASTEDEVVAMTEPARESAG